MLPCFYEQSHAPDFSEMPPTITFSDTILWLKVILSVAALVLLYFRYRSGKRSEISSKAKLRTRVILGAAVLFSFAVFHDLGTFAGGKFVHYGEMFHYYLGSKYFKELGYYDLYNAVVVADTEQGNALANLPFYTDLRTYEKTSREAALGDVDRVKRLFSEERWNEFKGDVFHFKEANGTPGMISSLMDHGYNPSPASSFFLSLLTNAVPVTQMHLLAALDVLLVLTMIAIVFRTFGFDVGALFSIYFFVNILSGHEYISGSLLRYDWLLYIVIAVCLLEKGRYASSAFFLSLSAMMRVFPVVLFYGVAVTLVRKTTTKRALDENSVRFIASAAATALALFLLPALSLGTILRPWEDFYAKTRLHDSGVYVNHLGSRAMVLFEPSHLSLEKFAETYKNGDVVRHWQDAKENEFRAKRPIVVFASILVLMCVTAIVWRTKEGVSAGVLWSTLLVYTTTYLSTYYYAFLCLLVLLFSRRTHPLSAFVPLSLLLVTNISCLVTDYFRPSPIVFFTLINIYLFICLSAILGFELYTNVLRTRPLGTAASVAPHEPSLDVRQRRSRARAPGKARRK